MKALVIYCHPSPASFNAAILERVVATLEQAQADVQVIDLYRDGFDPALCLKDWQAYEDCSCNTNGIEAHVEALRWCDTLLFVYPTWWYGLPAVLKGWCDRVLVPGVAFEMPASRDIEPSLSHIKRLGVFTTCGASRWLTFFIGAPGRRTILRGIRLLCARRCRTAFLAHYLMDASTAETRSRHLDRVVRKLQRLIGAPRHIQSEDGLEDKSHSQTPPLR
ncbi:MAG: NAD(P)H-dependent oxidoreductase [Hyphomicrobiales bacterium]|nr:NAD(P)H-dependent oxidoreductase [Hyphomicrobiales bacterium]